MMQTEVEIKRRVKQGKKYIETKENAVLIKRTAKTSLVRLENGDVIKRKNKDVIWEK